MWLGTRLEPILAELYQTQEKVLIRRESILRRHPQFPYIYAHLDAKVRGDRVGVEFKTASSDKGWDGPEFNGLPEHYYAQVQHYMAVTGWEAFDVAVLFGSRRFTVYSVPRDETYIGHLLNAEVGFWQLVLSGDPPPVDGDPSTASAIAARFVQREDAELRPATPEEQALMERLADVKALLKVNEEVVAEAENAIKERIGPDAGMFGGGYKATWKSTPGSTYTVTRKPGRRFLLSTPKDEGE
jgi:predicted phage-related endonuclease